MAISTLDGVAAGARQIAPFIKASSGTLVAGRPYSWWAAAGIPGAGSFSGSLAGATLSSSDAGSIVRGNPVSGNSYLHSVRGTPGNTQTGVVFLIDRLWNNGGITITSTSAQTVNSVTWPSRCPTSATDDTPATSGFGVLIGCEVSAATGAGTPTITLSYTNSAGTASRSATNLIPTVASSAAGSFYPIGLQAGDTGVQSIQTMTLSATWTSGTINLVAYRVIAAFAYSNIATINLDPLSGGMGRIYDNSCLSFLATQNNTTALIPAFTVTETQG